MTPAEAALAVADALERDSTLGFSMISFYYDNPQCGTTACIAGWTCLLFGKISHQEAACDHFGAFDWETTAAGILGLTKDQARTLFYVDRIDGERITRETAVYVLREYARTGEVRWPRVNIH